MTNFQQSGTKSIPSVNGSTIDTNPNNYGYQKRINKRANKKPKHLMSQVSQEKKGENLELEVEKSNRESCRNIGGKSVTGKYDFQQSIGTTCFCIY